MNDASSPEVAAPLPCNEAPLSYNEDRPIEPCNEMACDLAEEVVRKFGSVRLRVTGTSMVPCLLPGDLVTVKRASIDEISPGEVALFKRAKGFGLHRVIAKSGVFPGGALLTRGDRLQDNDPLVSSEAVLGRVESIERNGQRLSPMVKRGFLISMIAALLRSSDVATYLYLRVGKLSGKFLRDGSAKLENGYTAR